MSQQIAEHVSPLSFDGSGFDHSTLLELYRELLLPRMIEEKMLLLLRQGKVSKWFSGIGQEAIAVGTTMALKDTDTILPLHRNLGVFTSRKFPLEKLFAQWQGKRSGYTKGRDRSFHFGAPERRVIGMISHLGAMLGVADGIALGGVLDHSQDVVLVYSGDGGASEGDFHEALNVASVWDLPVIVLIENNGYGLSTPSREQFRHRLFVDKALGYGLEGITVDGNNILEVYSTTKALAARVRQSRRPILLEAMTFRMRGHEEASGTKYVPPSLFEQWKTKDPVTTYETFLLESGRLTPEDIKEIRAEFKATIEEAWEKASAEPEIEAHEADELKDVYAPQRVELVSPRHNDAPTRRFVDAIAEGLHQAMVRDPRLVLMGQDIAEYGGVFKVTDGFLRSFGKERVRNTPLCESAIVGAGLGLSISGRASMVEMQFADFVTCGFNQIVNNLAKTHYRWSHAVNVTIRMPTGAGVGAGPFHSQSTEAWFTHVPGLMVVYPSSPFDAKGLLTSSLVEPNPVLFFEHKYLYRSIEGPVPESYYNLPLGKAHVVRTGEDATIVTYGLGVHWALEAAAEVTDASIEIVDLRTLRPWDKETVFTSVAKTGKCLVLHEDTLIGGFGGEIAAAIGEEQFHALDAPIMRLGSLETPVPFTAALEYNFFPKRRLRETLRTLLGY
jgi:2-oxoisovalerate dehydrogenase E1 component